MRKALILFLILGITFGLMSALGKSDEVKNGFSLLPRPERIALRSGVFSLAQKPEILVTSPESELTDLAAYLALVWKENSGYLPEIRKHQAEIRSSARMLLSLVKSPISLGEEGYRLKIAPHRIEISALRPAGLFYGIQTLRQLLEGEKNLPCVEIQDRPQFPWRGMLLDCCRHFMPIDLIKRYIDLLADHKMNIFHWHLTEDQGWRLEIKRYPRLTEVGAWRIQNGRRYGGFYTQEEVKDVVAYAQARFVTVVPEIEMPGHSLAALAAYPEYSCTGRPVAVETHWGIFDDVLCPGKESTFKFVQNILDEVCALFPSSYIHIGGDECPKDRWKVCPDCQSRIRAEKLKNENELQGYFTRRIESYLQTKGRRIIGWDEILEGGVSPKSVVQSWRGFAGAIAAAKQGNPVISSPWQGTYFYCPQVPEEVRINYTTLNSLDKVYAFNPVPNELTPKQALSIMGGECCLWTEYTLPFEVDPQMFPRLCAFAEAVWSPQTGKNFGDFSARLEKHLGRLGRLGVDYHRAETKVGQWQEGQIGRMWTQLSWDVTPFITREGIYRFNFVQNAGADEILFEWAALFEDGEEIFRFTELNRSLTDTFSKYPLQVTRFKPGALYTLRVSAVASKDKAQSAGSIWLRYFGNDGLDLW
ncbi:MAG: beta-N-acetylhexosaminidase [Candidatus Aminicenantales bacterium]